MLPADLSTLASLCRGSLDVTAGGGIAFAMFSAGLAAGATHCAAMCGPLVLTQVGALPAPRCTRARMIAGARMSFHLGRAATYAALGGLAGGMGRWLLRWGEGTLPAAAIFLTVGAVVMALLLVAPRGAGRWEFMPSWITAAAKPLFRDGWRNGVLLGLLLGLLPCGLVYGALAVAAATGSALSGALAMLAFAAGTAPALMSIGVIGRAFGVRLSGRWQRAPLAINTLVVGLLALRAWL
jgi:sulfite exporter TauE/SafE